MALNNCRSSATRNSMSWHFGGMGSPADTIRHQAFQAHGVTSSDEPVEFFHVGPKEIRCRVVRDLTLPRSDAPNGWVMLRSQHPQMV